MIMENRREFIRKMAASTLAMMAMGHHAGARGRGRDRYGELLPLRPLGRTGMQVTMLGVGGFHLGCAMSEKEAERTVETALEGGVRFFDCAQGYCDGKAETRAGKVLTPKYRDEIFLMTKTLAPTAADARRSFEQSLKNLKTGYLDLWQVHSLKTLTDADQRIQHGVLDVMLEMKQKGLAGTIGFTGHVHPAVHLRMLEQTDIFECCQLPVNVVDPNDRSFIGQVLPKLVEREMGIIVIKALGGGSFFASSPRLPGWSVEDPVIPSRISVKQALDFVWSLPVSTIVTGAENADMLQEKIDMAREFQALGEKECEAMIAQVADMVGIAESNYKSDEYL